MKDLRPPHEPWMHAALETAALALPHDVPVGAVLVKDNQVIARACNRREIDHNPVAHAEILVLQAAAARLENWRLSGSILYVTLEPCPMCASAIQQARVGQVVFGAYDPILGACGSQSALLTDSATLPILGGVLEDPCGALLKSFFQKARRTR